MATTAESGNAIDCYKCAESLLKLTLELLESIQVRQALSQRDELLQNPQRHSDATMQWRIRYVFAIAFDERGTRVLDLVSRMFNIVRAADTADSDIPGFSRLVALLRDFSDRVGELERVRLSYPGERADKAANYFLGQVFTALDPFDRRNLPGSLLEACEQVQRSLEERRARLGLDASTAVKPAPDAERRLEEELSLEARGIAWLFAHPDWTTTRIAEVVGCARETLHRYPNFQKARELLRLARDDFSKVKRDDHAGTESDARDDSD